MYVYVCVCVCARVWGDVDGKRTEESVGGTEKGEGERTAIRMR